MKNVFVGKKLAELRKLKGRTQSDVADHFHISKQAVSKWENGHAMPDVLLLPELAQYFGVEMDYFFDEADVSAEKVNFDGRNIIISIKNLTKRYDKKSDPVLQNITLDLYDGVSTAIMGPSGSGKTTLVNCMAGLESITEGSVTVLGKEISRLKEPKLTAFRRKHTSYIFQQYNLIDVLNVVENIKLPYKTSGERIDKNRMKELLQKLGLNGKEKAMPAKLSGGQQQRVAIARALLGKNKIIFADEPTGALDFKTGNEVLALLLTACKEFHSPAIIITHDSKVAAQCDVVHFVADGKIVKTLTQATVAEISGVMERLGDYV